MNITLNVDLPDMDLEMIDQIKDLEARVAWFVGEQVALERWRQERHQSQDRDVVMEALQLAESMKEGGQQKEEVADRLLRRWDEIMTDVSR